MSNLSPLDHSSPLALGTAGFGTGVPTDAAIRLLDHYVASGGNHIDTAHDYASWMPGGAGASETTIGQWLRNSGARKQIILATKVGCTQGGKKQIRPEVLRRELTISLERLGVESVDLLWLHRDDPSVPVDDILHWVEDLRRENKFSASGASNWTAERLEQARVRAIALGLPGFCASQCGWNLAAIEPNSFPTGDARFIEAADETWHAQHHFPLVAWEAQAGGFFSGRYEPGTKPASSRANTVTAHYANPANWQRLAIATEIAQRHGATPNQVALAWLRQQAFPVISIVGPRTIEQLDDSLSSRNLTLSADELRRLRSAN
jgi:aryl-alcohol dehydrogenase-like predicted oxidoreductase